MLFHYIENIAFNGTVSRSSDYYWKDKKTNLTADLAITCEPTYYFISAWCATILHSPMQYLAWWMLTFPVDTMYITNVQIYHRNASKINLPFKKKKIVFPFNFQSLQLNGILMYWLWNRPVYNTRTFILGWTM